MPKITVCGLGLMGQRMMQAIDQHPQFSIHSIYDLDPKLVDKTASQYSCKAATEEDELLNSGADCLYIATPPAHHLSLATKALNSKLPIFLEKPLSSDLKQAKEFCRQAKHASVAINFPFATLPVLEQWQKELASQDCGEVLRAEIHHHFSSWPRSWHKAGAWLAENEEGGYLREVFSHFAFLALRLLGPLRFGRAATLFDSSQETETRCCAQLFAGDTEVNFNSAVGGAAPDSNHFIVYASKKSYRLRDWGELHTADAEGWHEAKIRQSSLANQLDELQKMLSGSRHQLATADEALEVMKIVETLRECAD